MTESKRQRRAWRRQAQVRWAGRAQHPGSAPSARTVPRGGPGCPAGRLQTTARPKRLAKGPAGGIGGTWQQFWHPHGRRWWRWGQGEMRRKTEAGHCRASPSFDIPQGECQAGAWITARGALPSAHTDLSPDCLVLACLQVEAFCSPSRATP